MCTTTHEAGRKPTVHGGVAAHTRYSSCFLKRTYICSYLCFKCMRCFKMLTSPPVFDTENRHILVPLNMQTLQKCLKLCKNSKWSGFSSNLHFRSVFLYRFPTFSTCCYKITCRFIFPIFDQILTSCFKINLQNSKGVHKCIWWLTF